MLESSERPDFDVADWMAQWLVQPQFSLGGRRPIEYVDIADGRAILSPLLRHMQPGVYAFSACPFRDSKPQCRCRCVCRRDAPLRDLIPHHLLKTVRQSRSSRQPRARDLTKRGGVVAPPTR